MKRVSVGPLALAGRALLAPMSGISDWPFRRLAARFGATLVVSEMVASERLVAREAAARLKVEGRGLKVHAVQLAACRAQDLTEAARIAQDAGADLIDINMGCPAKRVFGGFAGSALMADVDHAASLIAATVAAVNVPVTVKMRLGLDKTRLNAPELARRAQEEGAALVTVHGRTRAQRYKGNADWAAIAAVKDAVTIPVVANGDCMSTADARRMLQASGADAVMVGRAALGRPWLPGAIAAELDGRPLPDVPVGPHEVADFALEHFDSLIESAGARLGVRTARKHSAAYLEPFEVPQALRRRALTEEGAEAARRALAAAFAAASGPSVHEAASSVRAAA